MNLWTRHAADLGEAYVRAAGPLRFDLVTRALRQHLPTGSQRVIDIGGGYGEQAVRLARLGHDVVILDIDQAMLGIAAQLIAREPAEVAGRIALVHGDGTAYRPREGPFDLVCCHSVLMYEADFRPLLAATTAAARAGGLISILALNSHARAMRCGLQGRWREAIESLEAGQQRDAAYIPSHEHRIEDILDALAALGARHVESYGVGVFTDHLTEVSATDEPELISEAEWLAGSIDPYRQVARCVHLVLRKN